MLLKETVDDDVSIYCVFDSDYHTEEVIATRKAEAKKIGVNIHIWQKKELENYLIVPTAILRILKLESKKATHLTVTDIENIIKESAQQMEDGLIDKLADEIQKQDRKLSISVARKVAKTRIDSLVNRVCGKDLLTFVSKWAQENYKVSLSPIKLAANLQAKEMDGEIINLISAIENCQTNHSAQIFKTIPDANQKCPYRSCSTYFKWINLLQYLHIL